jgi:hypothetical protein
MLDFESLNSGLLVGHGTGSASGGIHGLFFGGLFATSDKRDDGEQRDEAEQFFHMSFS